jgi:uncharacterized protein GlcG (DUF336 family)
MLTISSISCEEAEAVIAAATRQATRIGVPQNIAIVDAAGHLVGFKRMDGAKFTSIEIAMAKAFTAAGAQAETKAIGPRTLPGEPGFGIQTMHGGRFTTLAGGIPLRVAAQVVGAIGVSSGSTAQDHEVAEAGATAFEALGLSA